MINETSIDYQSETDPVDSECIELCKAINRVDGVETTSSCCGHGTAPFHIFFRINEQGLKNLPIITYYIDSCHTDMGWSCRVWTGCNMSLQFIIESTSKGKKVYREVNKLTELINKAIDAKEFEKQTV